MEKRFKISSALKDIIGRDLITNDFVAIFELVKNAFDAHAKRVDIEFDGDSLIIWDDGKGMSQEDITSKWLFVAYSAKRNGEEDVNLPRDYRDEISLRRGYAGNKGIGRFSCDRLGKRLDLYSRPIGGKRVEHLHVDWTSFEEDSKREFATIDVGLSHKADFPMPKRAKPPKANGVMLVISDLREMWDYDKIHRLRSYLAKLVDPFQATADLKIFTHVAGQKWHDVEGRVGNKIVDLLDEKTARIVVTVKDGTIHTTLRDRGVLIYEIEEASPYLELAASEVETRLYFLNRSAKHTFTGRMGLQPVQFGNLFLFVNGFRIYPVGEPTDDTFGIGRRKQQGTSRYLGLRDILGKISVSAPVGIFREASSRDAGLTDTPAKLQLYEMIMRHVVQRLERYVVTVNWADSLDQDSDNASGLRSDSARTRIIRVVQALVGSQKIKLIDYDRELIDIVNERSTGFEEAMEGLALVAQETGDPVLLARVERSRQRFEELKQAEIEAKQHAEEETQARRVAEGRARAAELRAQEVGVKLQRVEKQAQMLLNSQAQGSEELQLLHHQVIIYATEVQALTRRSMRRLGAATLQLESVMADLEQIAFQNSRILAVTRLATQANFKLNADKIQADILQYLKEYAEKVATLYGDIGSAAFNDNGLSLERTFRPIDIAIVIDNLFSNSGKADARSMTFNCRKSSTGGAVEIVVSDDGRGIDQSVVDTAKLFERGYSGSPRGSGLGLYHAKQVLEDMGGSIGLDPERPAGKAQFVIRLPREAKKT
ncbi:ATP-binding protein [Nevskia soli]|uniref:ATP-binding protein n=1 Tax=Nevskia soli TaxID=418856 RepID=UPI0004A7074D|nr:ATP-binding protein [Nevskia soli]